MKRILSLCLLLASLIAAQAQDTKYTVTLNVPQDGTLSAYAGIKSGDYIYRQEEFAVGEEVHLTGSLKAEYSCTGWTDEQGRQVCDSLHYIFTMPARNIELTGHTTYDPANPPGPREDGYTDTWNRLYLRSNPEFGGTFTWGPGAEAAQNWLVWTGYEFTVTAYPATGFKFAGWQLDGKIVSNDNPYTFTMPERDMTLYAMYEYDPETPANPHGNKWNKESGELIMSDFVPGYLYNKVAEVTSRDPWHSDWDLIKSATIDGPSTDASLTYDYPIDISVFTNYASNVEFIDYSRTSGITKVPRGCFNKKSLKQVLLPATITTIGEYAFRNAESLTTVTCFATTPPVFEGRMPGEQGYTAYNDYENWAFDVLNKDNIIVHVPAEAVPLYQQARGWKELMILPITTGVQRLTVTLPSSGGYKDMFLELVNTKTLQSQRYVITNATSYTFNNLIRNTQHCLYLKNQRGDVLGKVEDIDIQDKDVQVSFADLKTPIDVTLRLLLPNGTALPSLGEGSGVAITWTDRQGNYLGQGATLSQQLSGTQVIAKVKLGEELGRQYQNPADTLFEVKADTPLMISLTPFATVELSGTVTAESTGIPVRGATITVSQMLNGTYPVTQITKTGIDGHYTLTVNDAPTNVTVTHSEYLKASPSPSEGGESTGFLPSTLNDGKLDVALRDLSGTIIDLDLYYQPAIHDGEEAPSEEYQDWANVGYSVYDVTHQTELTQLSAQYPILVLVDQDLPAGTELRVTATSTTRQFIPVAATCHVDTTGRATATLPIVQLGQVEATFEMTDNQSVVALLYDEQEQLVGWARYTGVSLTLRDIPDGRYHLITMGGDNTLFTSFNSLYALNNIGLVEDVDYIDNRITVSSGHITQVSNPFIPAFDETGFLYTGDLTSCSVNKSEVTVGQYVTVKAQVDFKPAYSADHMTLLFDLPEGCALVDGSVMVGNHVANYVNGWRLSVEVDDITVVPTQSGTFQVSATVSADLNGTNTRQPIGQAVFTAEDLTITVPETTGRRLLPVTGMAVPLSLVEVFDGGVSIGQTNAIGTGYFSVMCPLIGAYNLSEHDIYAIVTTPEGLQMQSETKTVKVDRSHLTPVVTYQTVGTQHEHNNHQFVFDFRTNEVNPKGIKVSALGQFYINFRIDFYDESDLLVNDTTAIKDVILYVLYEHGNVETHHVKYNERQKCWFVQPEMHYDNLPVNVDVDYTLSAEVAFDRQEFEDRMQDLISYAEESRQRMLETYHLYDDISDELDNQALYSQLESLLDSDTLEDADLDRLETLVTQLVGTEAMSEADAQYAIDFSELDALLAKEELTDAEEERMEQLIDTHMADVLAITTDSIGEQQLATLLTELENSYKTLTEETRDSLMCLSTFFYLPDTVAVTLPNGDVSMLLVGETRSAQLDIKNLDSIDREQLLAEGYTEVPTTDGNYFYYLATGDTYKVIDAVEKKLYSKTFIDDGAAAVRHKEVFWGTYLGGLSLSTFLPKGCFSKFDDLSRHIAKTAEQLRQTAGDVPGILINSLTNLIPIIVDVEEIMKCLYDEGHNNLDIHIHNAYNNGLKKYQSALTKFQEQFDKAKKALSIETTKVKRLKNMQQRLEHQIRYYNSRLSRAEQATDVYKWNAKLISAKDKLQQAKTTFNSATNNLKNLKQVFQNSQRFLTKAEKALAGFKKFSDNLLNLFSMVPVKLIPDNRILKKIPWSVMQMPVIGPIVKLFPAFVVCIDNVHDMQAWDKTHKAVKAVMPCEGEPQKAQQLLSDCEFQFGLHGVTDIVHIGVDLTAWIVDVFKVAPSNFLLAKALDITSCIMGTFHPGASQKAREDIERRLKELDCDKDPDPDPEPDPNDPNGDWIPSDGTIGGADLSINHSHSHPLWNFINLWFVRDPAGYVYEAVNSNRVEGVRTTCYYKETKEDMYGDLHDEAVVWDAETYAQENPLFTDADGRYQWDVPTGLWQVKYEKQGYETTYSDWLPVPPPQLEVNVGITQMKQPNVQKVRAFEDGIDIIFDKYMRPHTLTDASVSVVKNGQVVAGKVEMLNAESGYQTPDSMYASKMRLSFSNNLSAGDKVTLTVKRSVESYAGLQMQNDFTQEFTVEQRIEALVADTLVNVQEGRELMLTVHALPAAAAKGKKLKVTTSDAEVINLHSLGEGSEVGFDQNGEAKVALSALTQGTSIVRFTLANDEEQTAATLITVRDSLKMQVAKPRSSRLNGITLYTGSEIRLNCKTSGATILYTLDGSCPCDPASGHVQTYSGPIILNGSELTIKAMATAPGMDDSPVVEFNYKGKERPTVIEAPALADEQPAKSPTLYFRLNGQRITQPERGITIVRHRDGTVHKVTVR